MRGKRLSVEIVKVIYFKKDNDLSESQICKDLLTSKTAVHNALKRRENNSMSQQKVQLTFFSVCSCSLYSVRTQKTTTTKYF